MDRGVLRQTIMDQQTKLGKAHGLVEREIDIEDLIEGEDIVIISGIRRCGKSTLLRMISDRIEKDTVLINFDDIRFTKFDVENFSDIEDIISELFDSNPVYLLDEIQNIEMWQRWVNNLHDKGIKVFITGSNSKLLSSEISTYLTGRNRVVYLTPFSFREFLSMKGLNNVDIGSLTSHETSKIRRSFIEYMKTGGFPDVIKRGRVDISRNYFEDILMKDILVRHGIREVRELKDLALYLVTNSGSSISYSTLKKVTGIKSLSTIKRFIDHLDEAYLMQKVERFSFSIKKQKAIPAKIYSSDIGFLHSVSFNFSRNDGPILENLVLNHLLRKNREVYYHLESKECDFIVKDGLKVSKAIQVSYSLFDPVTRKRELLGLFDAMKCYGLKEGMIITFDEEEMMKKGGYEVKVIPAWKWILMD